MPHPTTPPKPSELRSYVADRVLRYGLATATILVERHADIWDQMGWPSTGRVLRDALRESRLATSS